MGGIPNPDSSTQQVGPFGVLGNTGLSALPNMTRANVEYALKQRLKNGSWKDSSDEFWTGVDPDGVNPWGTRITQTIGEAVTGSPQTGDITETVTQVDGHFTTQRGNLQGTINGIINKWFGWVGDIWELLDLEGALEDQANTVATLAAAVQALQNNESNQNVGGISAFVDFSGRADSTTLGSDFDQTYSGSGTGVWGIKDGRAAWYSVAGADRDCVAVYNVANTTTKYQKIGVAFSSAPVWVGFPSGSGHNFIYGRMNAAGTEYVYADFTKYTVELGCVVGGVKTFFVDKTSGFSFKSNATYWLECGVGVSTRSYRVLENGVPVLDYTEGGGGISVYADTHRHTGFGVHADASGLGTAPPARVLAYAFADNQPPTLVGSGARMVRTSTSTVTASSGSNLLPSSFFGSAPDATPDIVPDTSTGRFTVSISGWYNISVRLMIKHSNSSSTSNGADYPPFPLHLLLYKNGTLERWIGPSVLPYPRGAGSSGSGVQYYGTPDCAAGETAIFLQGGDYVQIGYNADATETGFWTGEASGVKTYFSITLANRSLA